jgi:hypothetical protein
MSALYHQFRLQGAGYSVILYENKNLVEVRFLSVSMFGNQDSTGMAKGGTAEGGITLICLPGCRVNSPVTVIRNDGELSQMNVCRCSVPVLFLEF